MLSTLCNLSVVEVSRRIYLLIKLIILCRTIRAIEKLLAYNDAIVGVVLSKLECNSKAWC